MLCSTATRTRQTLERTRIDAPVNFVDRLYDATPGAVIEEINGVESRFGPDVETLLVIGHEPAMSALALGLASRRRQQCRLRPNGFRRNSRLRRSRCCAPAEPWDQLALSGAALVGFHVPR